MESFLAEIADVVRRGRNVERESRRGVSDA
jgi:hypothetical protein